MTAEQGSAPSAPTVPPFDPVPLLAAELSLPRAGVAARSKLLAEGATVPFIARYRKEATGGLDEVQIRAIEERRAYVLELDERRARRVSRDRTSRASSRRSSRRRSSRAPTKAELEDLYLPYKPKRRTRAIIAASAGSSRSPSASGRSRSTASPRPRPRPSSSAEKEVPDVAAALAGARDICAERIAEDADVRKLVARGVPEGGRDQGRQERGARGQGRRSSTCTRPSRSPSRAIPSHRFLAIRRGEAEGVLRAAIDVDGERLVAARSRAPAKLDPRSPWAGELRQGGRRRDEAPAPADRAERRARRAEDAPPTAPRSTSSPRTCASCCSPRRSGPSVVLGIDPGQRTGCKCAVVDDDRQAPRAPRPIYLVQGDERDGARARRRCARSVAKHTPARDRRRQRHRTAARPRRS